MFFTLDVGRIPPFSKDGRRIILFGAPFRSLHQVALIGSVFPPADAPLADFPLRVICLLLSDNISPFFFLLGLSFTKSLLRPVFLDLF